MTRSISTMKVNMAILEDYVDNQNYQPSNNLSTVQQECCPSKMTLPNENFLQPLYMYFFTVRSSWYILLSLFIASGHFSDEKSPTERDLMSH